MDECFLDVTASQVLYGSGKEIADQIRCRMKNELGLTVSIEFHSIKYLQNWEVI